NYSKTQLLEKAKSYFEKSLSISITMKNKQWEMFNIGILADVNYELKEFEKAYLLNNEYSKLKDSIFSQSNKNKIAALENQKALLEKDREISLRELKIEQKEKEKWYFTGGLILLTVIGGMLWYQNQTRKRKNEALRKLNKELDEANKTKARFFSILNHDLRAPVSQLIQFIHLQHDAPDLMNETTKLEMQQKTLKGAEHLLSTMEQLLLWSKSQMERFEPKFENVTLESLFEEIKQTAQQHPEINFEFELITPKTIHTDPDYLKTVLRNLNGNAIKALKNQSEASIVWKSYQEEKDLYISIIDNGPGGDKDTFKALFDEQSVIGTKTGLGMHLIRDLVKAIKGTISLHSEPGKGTSITLHFKA
ncbi:MAG: sensor histidine kinase, partial [Flavobacterium sp.]